MNALQDFVGTPLGVAVLKGTIVVALMTLLSRCVARRVSAAWRHAAIMAALSVHVVVIGLAAIAPELRWHVLPRMESTNTSSVAATGDLVARSDDNSVVRADPIVPRARITQPSAVRIFSMLWFGGSVLFLGGIVATVAVTARRRRNGIRLTSSQWLTLLAQCQQKLGSERPVALVVADGVSSPFLWGALRPAIVLPEAASEWGLARKRVVLLHELAHLQRRDVEFAFAAQVVRALFWWNPVLWWALREAEDAREIAADDAALNAGVDPGGYVSEIVELVRYSRRAALYPAFAEGRTSRFERRMTSALARRAPRQPVTRRGITTIAAITVLAGCGTATLASRGAQSSSGSTGCRYDGGQHLDVARKLPDGRPVWKIEWSGGACHVSAEFIGGASYDIVSRRVVLPGPADTFRLRVEHGAVHDSLVVTRTDDPGAHAVVGANLDEADLSLFIVELEQHTGYGAAARVSLLLPNGGYAAVIAEAQQMQVDHAVGRYLTEALQRRVPTATELGEVLALAASRVTNEYQLVTLLNAAAPHRALQDPSIQAAYRRAANALRTIAGRQSALAALANHHPGSH